MNMLLWSDDILGDGFQPIFEMLVEAGIDAVEVPVFSLDPAPYDRLGDRLRSLGLDVLALTARGPDANPIDPDPDVRRRGREDNLRALECAGALRASILTGPYLATPVYCTGAPPSTEERSWALETLSAMTDAAAASGITLAVESLNHFEHHLANTAAQTAAMCREIGHPRCGMVYDTFHAHIEESDVRAAILECADVLTYVHLSESHRATPGTGQVDWATTFEALGEIGYDGWMTLEAFSATNPQLVAMMKTWTRRYASEEQLVRDGVAFVRDGWSSRTSTRSLAGA